MKRPPLPGWRAAPLHPTARAAAICATLTAVLAATLAASTPAQAQLQARDGNTDGVVDAYYDPVLNLSWLASANAAAGSAQDDGLSTSDGLLTWAAAQAWVAGLSVAGSSGWRLPSIDASCNGNGVGYACSSSAGELGHHFHTNLGGQVGQPISVAHTGNFNLFTGVSDAGQWSGTAYASDNDQAGVLLFAEGYQDYAFKAFSEHAAWAVHDGDVLAAVPEPASGWTLLAGMLGLGWLAQRRRLGRVSAGPA